MQNKRYLHMAAVEPLLQEGAKPRSLSFRFYLRDCSLQLPPQIWDGKLEQTVAVKKLPKLFSQLECARLPQDFVGYIDYEIKKGKATTIWYDPKFNAPSVRGLGYYLELLATSHLLKEGIASRIKASFCKSTDRTAQLCKAGLPRFFSKKIREWMEGLARGVRRRAEGYAQKETA